jgi:hypothetical protein
MSDLERAVPRFFARTAAKSGVTVVDAQEEGVPLLKLAVIRAQSDCARNCETYLFVRADLHVGEGPSKWNAIIPYGKQERGMAIVDVFSRDLMESMQTDGVLAKR